jgi:hypothetical protein
LRSYFRATPLISIPVYQFYYDFRALPLIIMAHAILPGASPRHLNTNLSEANTKGRRPDIYLIQSATINDFRALPLIFMEHTILPGASPRHLSTNLFETIIKGRRPGISVNQSATINDFRATPLIIIEHTILPGASPRHLNTNLFDAITKGRRPGISVSSRNKKHPQIKKRLPFAGEALKIYDVPILKNKLSIHRLARYGYTRKVTSST